MTFRYIGSKARVVEQIAEHIGYPNGNSFVDAFCGTGAVAEIAAELGWSVRLNDHLVSATVMAAARLLSENDTPFRGVGGYSAAIAALNSCEPKKGFIWREYSPASYLLTGIERRYFTEANAAKIDGIRATIRAWKDEGRISRPEEVLLVADLLSAANRSANIAGTYGCFLSKWTRQAFEPLALRTRQLKSYSTSIEMSNVDALGVRANPNDLVYLDPPYTKRQYASYYHILETIALGDEPTVEGVAGLRPWKSLASDYCYKVRALSALTKLITALPSRRILLSYNNEGHVELGALRSGLEGIGNVVVHELASVGRYRPNLQASATRSSVKEFLIIISKPTIQAVSEERMLSPA